MSNSNDTDILTGDSPADGEGDKQIKPAKPSPPGYMAPTASSIGQRTHSKLVTPQNTPPHAPNSASKRRDAPVGMGIPRPSSTTQHRHASRPSSATQNRHASRQTSSPRRAGSKLPVPQSKNPSRPIPCSPLAEHVLNKPLPSPPVAYVVTNRSQKPSVSLLDAQEKPCRALAGRNWRALSPEKLETIRNHFFPSSRDDSSQKGIIPPKVTLTIPTPKDRDRRLSAHELGRIEDDPSLPIIPRGRTWATRALSVDANSVVPGSSVSADAAPLVEAQFVDEHTDSVMVSKATKDNVSSDINTPEANNSLSTPGKNTLEVGGDIVNTALSSFDTKTSSDTIGEAETITIYRFSPQTDATPPGPLKSVEHVTPAHIRKGKPIAVTPQRSCPEIRDFGFEVEMQGTEGLVPDPIVPYRRRNRSPHANLLLQDWTGSPEDRKAFRDQSQSAMSGSLKLSAPFFDPNFDLKGLESSTETSNEPVVKQETEANPIPVRSFSLAAVQSAKEQVTKDNSSQQQSRQPPQPPPPTTKIPPSAIKDRQQSDATLHSQKSHEQTALKPETSVTRERKQSDATLYNQRYYESAALKSETFAASRNEKPISAPLKKQFAFTETAKDRMSIDTKSKVAIKPTPRKSPTKTKFGMRSFRGLFKRRSTTQPLSPGQLSPTDKGVGINGRPLSTVSKRESGVLSNRVATPGINRSSRRSSWNKPTLTAGAAPAHHTLPRYGQNRAPGSHNASFDSGTAKSSSTVTAKPSTGLLSINTGIEMGVPPGTPLPSPSPSMSLLCPTSPSLERDLSSLRTRNGHTLSSIRQRDLETTRSQLRAIMIAQGIPVNEYRGALDTLERRSSLRCSETSRGARGGGANGLSAVINGTGSAAGAGAGSGTGIGTGDGTGAESRQEASSRLLNSNAPPEAKLHAAQMALVAAYKAMEVVACETEDATRAVKRAENTYAWTFKVLRDAMKNFTAEDG